MRALNVRIGAIDAFKAAPPIGLQIKHATSFEIKIYMVVCHLKIFSQTGYPMAPGYMPWIRVQIPLELQPDLCPPAEPEAEGRISHPLLLGHNQPEAHLKALQERW